MTTPSAPNLAGSYLASPDHDIFMAVHRPPTATRRPGVVICPPFGYEHVTAHRSLRVLGDLLAAAGHVVVRLDYPGRRNSGDRGVGADHLASWVMATTATANWVAGEGNGDVVVVGMRLGAIVAAIAAARSNSGVAIGSLVLFDPAVSGKRHLRELRSLQLMGVSSADIPTDPGGVNLLGEHLNSTTVAALEDVDLGHIAPRVSRCLVVSRPSHAASSRLVEGWRATGLDIDHHVELGLTDLFAHGAERAITPTPALAYIADFMTSIESNPAFEVIESPSHDESRSITLDSGVVETVAAFGTVVVRGVLAEPPAGVNVRDRAILLVNNGAHQESGPALAWSEWSRLLAAKGFRVLRISVRGFGNSDEGTDHEPPRRPVDAFFRSAFFTDIDAAVAQLTAAGAAEVTMIGLCASAFAAIDTATGNPAVTGAVAISVPIAFVPAERGNGHHRRAARRSSRRFMAWIDDSVLGEKVGRHLSLVAWRVLGSLRLAASPASGPFALTETHSELLIISPPDEAPVWLPRSRRRLRQLLNSSRARVAVIDGMDHAMFRDEGRAAATELVVAFCEHGVAGVDQAIDDRAERTSGASSGQAMASVRLLSS